MQNITPCLWFDGQAEPAAQFYTGIFPNSKITAVSRYPGAGTEVHGQKEGSVMVVAFELDGLAFTALNGGPAFKFNPAVSFMIDCDNQDQIDYYWDKLGEGGGGQAQQCGWVLDKFGASWQVVPRIMSELYAGDDQARSGRVMTAMLQMKKLDIARLRQAYAG